MTPRFDLFVKIIFENSNSLPRVKGEYWFDEHGRAQYADGDYGDRNHEDYVRERCGVELGNYFGLSANDHIEEKHMLDIIFAKVGESWGDIDNDPTDAIIRYLVEFKHLNESDATDLVMLAYGNSSRDGRDYAIKKWNWIRVHGNHIEVNRLNSETLKNVASGINDALEQEGELYEDDAYELAGQAIYNISTFTGKRYSISLDDMERGNVSGLEEIRTVPTHSAKKQVRDMDIAAMPSYYQKRDVLGDSVKFKRSTL